MKFFPNTLMITALALLLPHGAQSQPASTPDRSIPPLPDGYKSSFTLHESTALKGRIAFAATAHGYQRIFVLNLENREVSPLINGPGQNSYPAWSPDGSKIAFVSDRDGNQEIYVADFDGDNQKRLTVNDSFDDAPSWSADGKEIIYTSSNDKGDDGKNTNIYRMTIANMVPEQITSLRSGKNTTARLSPNGKQLAYSTNRFWPGWDVCIWDMAKQREQCPLAGGVAYCRPAWSKDSGSFLFAYGSQYEIEIGLMKIATNERQQLTKLEGREYDAEWSPSGTQIVFVGEENHRDRFEIFLYDVSDTRTAPLLTSKYSIRNPSWTESSTLALEAKRARERIEETAATAASPQLSGTPDAPQ